MPRINSSFSGFAFATGDINFLDYGATWYRRISDSVFHFIRLINWEDSVGTREAKEIGSVYNLQLAEVDLRDVTDEQLNSACQSCGIEDPQTLEPARKAETLFSYGLYAPLSDVNTSNFHKTFRQLAKYSRELSGNSRKHSAALNRKVNKLGSTAKEFAKGDLTSALVRGVIAEDPNALIITKMYAACSKSHGGEQ